MALLTPVDSIPNRITLMDFVALAPAKWAHLQTPKSLGFHYLIQVSNQLIFLKDD
jgi:hypothetical protein